MLHIPAGGLGSAFHPRAFSLPSREREVPLRVPPGCAEGPEGRDTLRPYPFAGGLRLVSPKRCRRSLLPGVSGCPPDFNNSLESLFVKGGLRGFGGQGVQEKLCIVSMMATEVQDASCRGFAGVPQFSLSSPKSGGAEKRSGSDGSLRVSLSPLFSPQDWGTKGVDRWLAGQPRQHSPVSTTSHWKIQDFYSVPGPGHRIPDTRGKQPC